MVINLEQGRTVRCVLKQFGDGIHDTRVLDKRAMDEDDARIMLGSVAPARIELTEVRFSLL